MKIAFVEPHLELYGGIRRIMELSNRLCRMGEEVTLYHPSGEPCRWMDGRAATKPTEALFSCEHDAVIFNNPPDYTHVRRARARVKAFYVLALYDREKLKTFNPKIFWPKKGRMLALKRALQMPFLKIANSLWVQRFLRDELGIESEVVLGGINREVFHPVDVAKDPDVCRVLATGDPRPFKGMETVAAAVEIMKARHRHVVLDSYYGTNTPQERMAEAYSAADIFANGEWPSGAAWSNPVAEAMACGVPVVCTDIEAVGHFGVHEETALLVPPRNPEAMAAAIERLIVDPGFRERLKSNAYKHIIGFDWDESARTMRRILKAHLG
jgi:glycosyltransferase involved in cell wall biosynthesis